MPYLIAGLLIPSIFLIARWITNWLADRNPEPPPPPPSGQPVDKATMIQDQVNSKILWDAPDYEVLEWLEQTHKITDDSAQAMLANAKAARARAIREKALYGASFSGIGAFACGGIVTVQWFGGIVFVVRTIFLIAAFGFFTFWFVKHLRRLLTGRTDTSAGL